LFTTNRGYTGHEMLDDFGIIHMNGRIYDPTMGRFMNPDPVVQELSNAQNLNRYSYVFNNPLSATDPSGYIGAFLAASRSNSQLVRTLASIAINIAGATTGGFLSVISTGFLSSYVSSGGSFRSGLYGAFSAGVFYGIGSGFDGVARGNSAEGITGIARTGLTASQFIGKVAAHGIAGGIMSELNGGKFGHGFASAGITQAFSPAVDKIEGESLGAISTRVSAAAVIGGTSSVASGGKFSNGAISGAFSRAFNEERHKLVSGGFQLVGEDMSDNPNWVLVHNPANKTAYYVHSTFAADAATEAAIGMKSSGPTAFGIEGSASIFAGVIGMSGNLGITGDTEGNVCAIISVCGQVGLGGFLGAGVNGIVNTGTVSPESGFTFNHGPFGNAGVGPAVRAGSYAGKTIGGSGTVSESSLSVNKGLVGSGIGANGGYQFCPGLSLCF